MKAKRIIIIAVTAALTLTAVLGFTYLLITGPFGLPKYVTLSIGVYTNEPANKIRTTNMTVLIPIVYIKDKPFYEFIKIKGWKYSVVSTEHGKMLKLHTDRFFGFKYVCNGQAKDILVTEVNSEVKVEPSKTINVSINHQPATLLRIVNYTVPVYTSHNVTVIVEMRICSGISLFKPLYNGKKYYECRTDRIVASGEGWINGTGCAKIEMYPRKHWYDL